MGIALPSLKARFINFFPSLPSELPNYRVSSLLSVCWCWVTCVRPDQGELTVQQDLCPEHPFIVGNI